MQTVCFFNNKGGVGKTTLATNIASFIATEMDRSVLLVDLDPQCNTTQLVVPDELQDGLFGDAKEASGTILEVVKPIRRGGPTIAQELPILTADQNRFGVALIPGHPSLSLFEDILSRAWQDMKSNMMVGLRQTLWVEQMASLWRDKYDLIIIDVGPSFGALNRTVLLGCDYFVSPLGCDLFSIIGLQNIGNWLAENHDTLRNSLQGMDSDLEVPEPYDNYDQIQFSRFIGYTVLQYITKSKGGQRRPTEAFERFRQRIPNVVAASLKEHIALGLEEDDLALGDVPNMYSIVPLAQYAQKPIHKLESADGVAGATFGQLKTYTSFISGLSARLVENLDKAEKLP